MISLPITWPTDEINAFCKQWHITELALFGSILRDDFRSDSDVDILVEFSQDSRWTLFDRVKMQQELTDIIQHPVDLVRKDTVQQSSNPIRRHNVLSTARTVYSQN